MPAFGVLIYFHYLSSIRTRVDQIAEDTRRSRKENRPVGPGIGWQSGVPYQSAPSGTELLKSLNGSIFDSITHVILRNWSLVEKVTI